jgi:hypothetical protein
MRTDTDVEQGDLYGSVWPARRLPQATECGVKLEEQYAGYTASIGLTTPSPVPVESFEAVIYRDQALDLAAALLNAIRKQ